MFAQRMLIGPAVVLFGVIATSTPALAQQDCGTDCQSCASSGKEGYNRSPSGEHNMLCLVTETGWCDECGDPVISADAISARAIARVLDAVDKNDIAAVVAAYGDRVLVDEVRGVAVVKGSACNPGALDTVVFLTKGKARSLRSAGAISLRAFLATTERPGVTR